MEDKTIAYILAAIAGAFFGYLWGKRRQKRKNGSIASAREARREQVENAKQKIVGLFERKEQVTNDDVEQLLQTSDRSAARYLDDLEQEGRIEQHGEIGRGVYYTKKSAK